MPLGWYRTIIVAVGGPFPVGPVIVYVLFRYDIDVTIVSFRSKCLVSDAIVSTDVTSFSASSLLVTVRVAIEL